MRNEVYCARRTPRRTRSAPRRSRSASSWSSVRGVEAVGAALVAAGSVDVMNRNQTTPLGGRQRRGAGIAPARSVRVLLSRPSPSRHLSGGRTPSSGPLVSAHLPPSLVPTNAHPLPSRRSRLSWRRRALLRALLPATLLSAAVAAPVAPVAAQSRAELEKVIRRRVLANGLEVIVVENHGVPLATVEVDVKNGSYTQPPDYAGLAHMYEHMFFKASQQFPAPDQFTQRATELGAVFNGTTQEERVNYYMTLPADSLPAAMRAVASALRSPLFRADELAREKEVVLGEYDRQEANPAFGFQNELTKRLYPGQYSRKNIIGDRQVIRTVTP